MVDLARHLTLIEIASSQGSIRSERSRSSPSTSPVNRSRLENLPSELLTQILILAGAEDERALARAAQACSTFDRIVHHPSQQTWAGVFNWCYDDPARGAAASPSSPHCDWKKLVVGRYAIKRLLDPEATEYGTWLDPNEEAVRDKLLPTKSITPVALATMYAEIPSTKKSQASRNMPLLVKLVRSKPFQILKMKQQWRHHLEGLDLPFSSERISLLHAAFVGEFPLALTTSVFGGYVKDPYTMEDYYFNLDTEYTPMHNEGNVAWNSVDLIVSSMRYAVWGSDRPLSEFSNMHQAERQEAAQRLESDSLRGPGLHGLTKPADPTAVWDWAGIAGVWKGLRNNCLADGRQHGDSLSITRACYRLTPVSGRVALEKIAYQRGGLSGRAAVRRLRTLHPTGSALPPIYFDGTHVPDAEFHSGEPYAGAPRMGFYGVVQLTTDEPPQLRWRLATRTDGDPEESRSVAKARKVPFWVADGVTIGAVGSPRGWFGYWRGYHMSRSEGRDGAIWGYKMQ